MSIKRFVPSAGLAVGVTIGTVLVMAAMIATEFTPQDKGENYSFQINPVELIPVIEPERKPPELNKKVEVPPPPPIMGVYTTSKVDVPHYEVLGSPISFDPKIILVGGPTMTPADTNEQPILRFPPNMPSRAERSGHCNVVFDVSAEGVPFNVQATFCTQSLFERPTLKSVQRWKYRPKIQNGRPVSMSGVKNRVSYRLTDERGNVIPE